MNAKTEKVFLNSFRVKEACHLKDMTLTDLASLMDCTSASLHNWFRDGFTMERAIAVAEFTGQPLSELQIGLIMSKANARRPSAPKV